MNSFQDNVKELLLVVFLVSFLLFQALLRQ